MRADPAPPTPARVRCLIWVRDGRGEGQEMTGWGTKRFESNKNEKKKKQIESDPKELK